MKLKLTGLFLLIAAMSFGQEDWKTHSKENYSIRYPDTWKIDTSGQMNSSFILFSEIEENETFRENINLLIQDLKGQNFTMKSYVALSENQIKNMVSNSKLIKSTYVNDPKRPYHVMVWSGLIGENQLKLKQHFYLIDEKAYVLSFTALPDTYDRFLPIADNIFKSFKIK